SLVEFEGVRLFETVFCLFCAFLRPALKEPINWQTEKNQPETDRGLSWRTYNRHDDYPTRNDQEDDGHHRIAPGAIWALGVRQAIAKQEDRSGNENIKERQREDGVVSDRVVRT